MHLARIDADRRIHGFDGVHCCLGFGLPNVVIAEQELPGQVALLDCVIVCNSDFACGASDAHHRKVLEELAAESAASDHEVLDRPEPSLQRAPHHSDLSIVARAGPLHHNHTNHIADYGPDRAQQKSATRSWSERPPPLPQIRCFGTEHARRRGGWRGRPGIPPQAARRSQGGARQRPNTRTGTRGGASQRPPWQPPAPRSHQRSTPLAPVPNAPCARASSRAPRRSARAKAAQPVHGTRTTAALRSARGCSLARRCLGLDARALLGLVCQLHHLICSCSVVHLKQCAT